MRCIYIGMINEMLLHAGFQDSVNDQLRVAKCHLTDQRKRHVNDLWSLYKADKP